MFVKTQSHYNTRTKQYEFKRNVNEVTRLPCLTYCKARLSPLLPRAKRQSVGVFLSLGYAYFHHPEIGFAVFAAPSGDMGCWGNAATVCPTLGASQNWQNQTSECREKMARSGRFELPTPRFVV